MIDLDGTTVPHFSYDISERVISTVKKAHEKVTVCLVTGRPYEMTESIIEKLAISGPCVLLNGAQIYDPGKKKMVHQLYLPNEDLVSIYDQIKEYSDHLLVHDGTKDVPAKNWQELEHIISFYLFDMPPQDVQIVAKRFENHPRVTTNRMFGSKPGTEAIEIIHSNATKQFGIYKAAKILSLETKDIIGVGDGYNDFALLMACGLKIAMGNAVPELKTIADFVAPPVEEDGLATVIEKFILSV